MTKIFLEGIFIGMMLGAFFIFCVYEMSGIYETPTPKNVKRIIIEAKETTTTNSAGIFTVGGQLSITP